MKILIVEDEIPARERLKALLTQMEISIELITEAGSIEEAAAQLQASHAFDLAFFDIQLSDGLSFDIFRRVNRQYIVNITAVQQLRPRYKGKLLLILEPGSGEEIIISQEQAGAIKEWLEI